MTVAGASTAQSLPGAGTHGLLIADTEESTRAGTAAWVGGELARGAKVYYKGWLPDGGLEQHWIAGPDGPDALRAAFGSGQLEFLDFPSVIERCGGTTEGLLRLQLDEIRRAVDEGWPSVAMSQESARRPMADDSEIAEFVEQERGYDLLAQRWPLRTLCQLTVGVENATACWESAALHHREVTDAGWSSSHDGERWQLRGALDAHVAPRFGATLHGALAAARSARRGPDLHVDVRDVEFMDHACAQVLALQAHSAAPSQRIVLHGADAILMRLVSLVGRPDTLRFAEETGSR